MVINKYNPGRRRSAGQTLPAMAAGLISILAVLAATKPAREVIDGM